MFVVLAALTLALLASAQAQARTELIQLPTLQIMEEQPVISSQTLLDLSQALQNRLQLSAITRFQIISGIKSQPNSNLLSSMFYISGLSLRTNRSFDREALIASNQCDSAECLVKLKIAAYTGDNGQLLSSIIVQPIEITDMNDNEPTFRQHSYEVSISENLVQSIPLEPPVDADSRPNAIQACSVREHTNLFNAFYNRRTQRLFLKVIRPLDRERVKSYALTLNCTDGASFTKTSLFINVLDANDNVPAFKRDFYNTSIVEHFGPASSNSPVIYSNLIQVVAADKDAGLNGQLIYSLPQELNFDYADLFRIDQATGWIQVDQRRVDYEHQSQFVLKVKVTDHGSNPVPAYTDVHVQVLDLNDNAPSGHVTAEPGLMVRETKSNRTLWVNEELAIGSTVAYLSVSDLDEQETNGNQLTAKLESVTFMANGSLDVTDRRDLFQLVPIVSEYDNMYFGLQVNGRLDREQVDFFDLTFQFSDSGHVTQQTSQLSLRIVLIDINDNIPVAEVTNLRLSIPENQRDMSLVQLIVKDADSEPEFRYELSGTPKEAIQQFSVNEQGWLQLHANGLDHEMYDEFDMTVRCYDNGGLFVDVYVHVTVLDKNDNLPVFEADQLHFRLVENSPVLTTLGLLHVRDLDSNASTGFVIRPERWASIFSVHNDTGSLVLMRAIDAEEYLNDSSIELQITAIDLDMDMIPNDRFNHVTVIIDLVDVNDNGPVAFDVPQFAVYGQQGSRSELLLGFNSTDLDRDVIASGRVMQDLRIVAVQRYTWKFVGELLRSQYGNRSELIELVDEIIRAQREANVKSALNVDLESLFKLESTLLNDSVSLSSHLILQSANLLNRGVYNFTFELTDMSSPANTSMESAINVNNTSNYLFSHATSKLFVLLNESTATTTANTSELLAELSTILDTWFSSTSHTERRFSNGDELELIEQEYVDFYTAQAVERANRIKKLLFAHSSIAIVALVSFFSIIAVILITVISYKHYTVSQFKGANNKIGGSSGGSIASDSGSPESASTISQSSVSTIQQDKPNAKYDYFSPSNSFFEHSIVQSNKRTFSYPPPSQKTTSPVDVIDCAEARQLQNPFPAIAHKTASSANSLEQQQVIYIFL